VLKILIPTLYQRVKVPIYNIKHIISYNIYKLNKWIEFIMRAWVRKCPLILLSSIVILGVV